MRSGRGLEEKPTPWTEEPRATRPAQSGGGSREGQGEVLDLYSQSHWKVLGSGMRPVAFLQPSLATVRTDAGGHPGSNHPGPDRQQRRRGAPHPMLTLLSDPSPDSELRCERDAGCAGSRGLAASASRPVSLMGRSVRDHRGSARGATGVAHGSAGVRVRPLQAPRGQAPRDTKVRHRRSGCAG